LDFLARVFGFTWHASNRKLTWSNSKNSFWSC